MSARKEFLKAVAFIVIWTALFALGIWLGINA